MHQSLMKNVYLIAINDTYGKKIADVECQNIYNAVHYLKQITISEVEGLQKCTNTIYQVDVSASKWL